MTPGPDGPPWEVRSGGRLSAVLVDGGAPASIVVDGVELVQHAASAFEPAMVQLWLRDRSTGNRSPLLGPGSAGFVRPVAGGVVVTGAQATPSSDVAPGPRSAHQGLTWTVTFLLGDSSPTWAWHLEVRNDTSDVREVDLVHSHDVALAGPGVLRTNELYVSQYLDITPLERAGLGTALAVRQNLPQGGRHPWCVLAADRPVVGWATDALDVHGWSARVPGGLVNADTTRAAGPSGGLGGDLPSRRRQHEHTLVTLQTERTSLGPGQVLRVTFAGLFLADHPAATSQDDVVHADEAIAAAQAAAPWSHPVPGGREGADAASGSGGRRAPTGSYDRGRELVTRDLTVDELRARWPEPWRVVERDEEGGLLSFFTADAAHVVTPSKELAVLRPHGTILRTGDAAAPRPTSLTATAWMTGSPLSYLTRGHASVGSVLTTVRGYLGLHRAYGIRLFVDVAGRWRLVDLPSAFAMTPASARWVHAFGPSTVDGRDDPGGVVEVLTTAPPQHDRMELRVRVVDGPARAVLAALHLATPADPLPAPRGEVRVEETADGVVVHLGGTEPEGGAEPEGAARSHDAAEADGVRAGIATLTVHASSRPRVGDDGVLFDDGVSRVPGVLTLLWQPAPQPAPQPDPGRDPGRDLRLALTVGVPTPADARPGTGEGRQASRTGAARRAGPDWWDEVTALAVHADQEEVERLAVSLPWLVRDAVVHHLAPRGLEQYTGGAWGTRDVTQGPLELLLALDRLDDARALLAAVFAAQNTDGSWPQAFGFLPGDEDFRLEPPHGDVVHWPVLALGRYLEASGDSGILWEEVPWYAGPDAPESPAAARASVLVHVRRALEHARSGFLPGTRLVAYGHGDWNDSLQPADPAMTRTLTSAWTVILHHQALRTLADGLEGVEVDGWEGSGGSDRDDLVAALRSEAEAVAADLRRHLLVDGELAGYAELAAPDDGAGSADGEPAVDRWLVHPRDTETGLRHGALQIIHALGEDLLDPDEARHHVELVREHLMGVDGVRLFDRPPGYHGGVMRHFQRAETATFVGREIGLMYVHAHLRWCEAMARWGDAEALWLGLQQVLSPAPSAVGKGARLRQGNTYSSSSDAACLDRQDFADRYAEVLTGAVGLEAGWRIYSSGPGVLLRIVSQSLLGVRRRGSSVEIDPVLPARLDGLRAEVPLDGRLLRLRYAVASRGYGPDHLSVGGRDLSGRPTANPYRPGGLSVRLADLEAALRDGGPELEVRLP